MTPWMGKPVGKVGGIVLGGAAVTPVGLMVLMIAFPVTWVKLAGCSGSQQEVEQHEGKVVLAEHVYASGEESYLYQVYRLQLLDPRTGAVASGPHVFKAWQWLGSAHGTGFLFGGSGVFGVSLSDGRVVLDEKVLTSRQPKLAGQLPRNGDAYRLDAQGRLLIDASDGRRWALDSTFTVSELDGEVPGRQQPTATSHRWGEQVWEGDRRRKLKGNAAMESYLLATFVERVTHGDTALVQHYTKLGESGGGEGMLLSLIGPDGKERWRWTSKRSGSNAERLVAAVQLGDVAVVQTWMDQRGLVALDLATGKELWTR